MAIKMHQSCSKIIFINRDRKIAQNFQWKNTPDMIVITCDKFHTLRKNFKILYFKNASRWSFVKIDILTIKHVSYPLVHENGVPFHEQWKLGRDICGNQVSANMISPSLLAFVWTSTLFKRNFLICSKVLEILKSSSFKRPSDNDKHQLNCDLILRKIMTINISHKRRVSQIFHKLFFNQAHYPFKFL